MSERNPPPGSLARAESLGAGGKELSFNNLVDVDAALDAVREFEGPAAVVVKHTNPCGVAVAASLVEAYRAARDADALSAFGGIVALNREVDEATAHAVAETFLECVVAPLFLCRGARGPSREEELAPSRDGRMARGRSTTPSCTSVSAAASSSRTATLRPRARSRAAKSVASAPPRPRSFAASSSRGACAST